MLDMISGSHAVTHSTAIKIAPPQDSAAEIACTLEAAAAQLQGKIEAVAPGRLVSVCIDLPAGALPADAAWGGDSRWLAPADGMMVHSVGVAAQFTDIDTRRFQAECAEWPLFGDGTAPPLLFFTAPPATQPGPPSMWLPRVLVRRRAGGATVILSARRDGVAIPDVCRMWLEDLRQLLEDNNGARDRPHILRSVSTPDDLEWGERVRAATTTITDGAFAKVVLARRLLVSLSVDVDANDLADRLAAVHPECCVFSLPHADGHVVAASPERLAVKRGAQVVSHALAGTAARWGVPDTDAAATSALLSSAKERREHALVVDAITAGLSDLCDAVAHARIPSVMRLRRVQHLWTTVTGRLRQNFGLLDVVARLHPTPAVLGFPRQAAAAWLAREEAPRDGLYTGIAGWIDRNGDGDAVMVLRSAHIEGRSATLWAGAGIMAESDPAAELAETDLKLSTMLDLLGGA